MAARSRLLARVPGHVRLVAGLFVASRVAILTLLLVLFPYREDSDVQTFARYGRATVAAVSEGRSPYDRIKAEYPPLSLVLMGIPDLAMDLAVAKDAPEPERYRWYRVFFSLQVALVDCLCFILVAWLVERRFAHEPPRQRAERLLVLVLCSAAIFTNLYMRFDAVLGAALVLALALMLSRAHYLLSFLVLAAGAHLKIAPLALAPVWVLGSLPARAVSGPWDAAKAGRLLLLGGWRVAALLLLIAALLAPFYLLWGPRSLDFIDYHRERGIEIESLYATGVLLATGLGATTTYDFGSVNVVAPALAAAAPWITAGLLLSAALAYFLALTRAAPEDERAARLKPDAFVLHALLALFLFLLANKVFSPQFLLWVIALAPLAPLPPRPRRAFFVLLLAACVVTKVVGFVFGDHVMGTAESRASGVTYLTGPTWLGFALTLVRNVLALAAGSVLAWRVVRPDGRWTRPAPGSATR